MKLLLTLFLFSLSLLAQAPPLPAHCSGLANAARIAIQYQLPGTSNWQWDCLYIPYPMTFSTGPTGAPQLGVSLPPVSTLPPPTVTYTSPTILQVGSLCSIYSECGLALTNALGHQTYSFTAGGPTITLTKAGTGLIYIYLSASGVITVANGAANAPLVTCTCPVDSLSTGFPSDSLPMWTWHPLLGAQNAPGAVWDQNGGQNVMAAIGR